MSESSREDNARASQKEKYRQDAKSWFKEAVYKMHSLRPDYVFLTETSAVPFGYSMKEAWREAFPSEPIPKFYRVEPHSEIGKHNQEGVKKYIEKRIKKDDATVIVFDESSDSNRPVTIFKYDANQKPDPNTIPPQTIFDDVFDKSKWVGKGATVTLAADFLQSASSIMSNGKKIGRLYGFRGCTPYVYMAIKHNKGEYIRNHPTTRTRDFLNTPDNMWWEQTDEKRLKQYQEYKQKREEKGLFHGSVVKDPYQRKRAIELIADLKQLGKEAGQELHKESEKQQSLEQRVSSTTAVIAFIGSLFFTSSNLTGNVIGILSNSTTSVIGIILFLIGIVATFFYIKRK